MRIKDQLNFALYEAVAINAIGESAYYENVSKLMRMQADICQAYTEGAIDQDEFATLYYEYSLKERRNIVGRKVARMGMEFYDSISEEFEKCVESWKKGGFCGKGSSIVRIVGITAAGGIRIAGAILVGPADWALSAATTLVAAPFKDSALTSAAYKTTAKPFIDEIRNHHTKTCEGIHATAQALKDRAYDLRKRAQDGNITTKELEKELNRLMKDYLSLAKSMDKERLSIEKDIDKSTEKLDRLKKHRQGVMDGYDEYHQLKHDVENMKQLHDSLTKRPKDKYDQNNKSTTRTLMRTGKTEAILTKYARRYDLKEEENGSYTKKNCNIILNRMIKDKAPMDDVKKVRAYMNSL